jgi:hypothetical protein
MSMVGCTMLVEMHLKLQKLKSSALQPFGGLGIMFLRNFIQLPSYKWHTFVIQLILNLHCLLQNKHKLFFIGKSMGKLHTIK